VVRSTLTLRTDCNDNKSNPRLKDYVKLFPDLREIKIMVVYPGLPGYEKPQRSKGSVGPCKQLPATRSGRSSKTSTKDCSLQSVSLAIHSSSECQGIKYESQVNTWIQKFRSSDQLRQVGMAELDHYHLELTLGTFKCGELWWDDFVRRLSLACGVPAKEVSICFRLTLGGEVERFLVRLLFRPYHEFVADQV
jgi:hypothetical protein